MWVWEHLIRKRTLLLTGGTHWGPNWTDQSILYTVDVWLICVPKALQKGSPVRQNPGWSNLWAIQWVCWFVWSSSDCSGLFQSAQNFSSVHSGLAWAGLVQSSLAGISLVWAGPVQSGLIQAVPCGSKVTNCQKGSSHLVQTVCVYQRVCVQSSVSVFVSFSIIWPRIRDASLSFRACVTSTRTQPAKWINMAAVHGASLSVCVCVLLLPAVTG